MIQPIFFHNHPSKKFNPLILKRSSSNSLQNNRFQNQKPSSIKQLKYQEKMKVEVQQPEPLQFWAWTNPVEMYLPLHNRLNPEKKQNHPQKFSMNRSELLFKNYITRKERKQSKEKQMKIETNLNHTERKIQTQRKHRNRSNFKKRHHQRLDSTAISVSDEPEHGKIFSFTKIVDSLKSDGRKDSQIIYNQKTDNEQHGKIVMFPSRTKCSSCRQSPMKSNETKKLFEFNSQKRPIKRQSLEIDDDEIDKWSIIDEDFDAIGSHGIRGNLWRFKRPSRNSFIIGKG